MKKTIVAAALCALFLPVTAQAGPIERACLNSDRQGVSRSLCGCIQTVADQTLRSADQRRVAKFFSDPDRAQEVRMSDRDSDEALWLRYKAFGAAAESTCAG